MLAYTFFTEVRDWCLTTDVPGYRVQSYKLGRNRREIDDAKDAFLEKCENNSRWFGPAFRNITSKYTNGKYTSKNRKFIIFNGVKVMMMEGGD
jgi:hypothetical protein